ncbi:glycoside hydrolase family 97 protein [Sunxiuqinia dokdonensis]|uniref:Alpha-glucosidase n=1 Tax=Sunxiuqinia dokdonensis TaxID=1409788 RepID=A0A0L8V9R9_9BACT|nr:glycoside hydrolase family 97 protein [Sunxiuqinia dokdonensis]KOH44957.1 alpha-glucosidase [Sunxiuqinia dokdonensis]
MKAKLFTALFLLITISAVSQKLTVTSPNKKISVNLFHGQQVDTGEWYLKVNYHDDHQVSEMIPRVDLGLVREDQDFSKDLQFLKAGKPTLIQENYRAVHGKRSQCSNEANEVVVAFENSGKAKMNLIVRAYNDGVAFRYEFPEKEGVFTIRDELTAYVVPDTTERWLQKFDLSNEGLYSHMKDDQVQQNWSYPALFRLGESRYWYLVHEADVDRAYCATKLSNLGDQSSYKVTLPYPHEGEAEALPTISLPWKSPWRVIILGGLSDIVESTLIDDISTPAVLPDTDWIKPGKVSWNYWSDNHGTRDFQTVCEFTDLAATMGWRYTLFDWEWDVMANGGNVEDAAKYALSKGVKPLIWYNSGMFKWITATPVDRMKTHENRMKEFAWLKEQGFAGVKIDFFLSEKQYMVDYYLDILEDAAQFELLVYFHGCLVPRGWARTYPHLMTYEGVRGAEWYNNNPELTNTAPEHNSVMAFTRNVVGSMDYTPVTFTNSQHPHITSYGHELALSVVFESALQHLADRPGGYANLPDAAKWFLKEVPAAWDDTKFLDGFPGRDVMIARQTGDSWYIGGINSENKEKTKTISFDFLKAGQKYKLTLIADGEHDKMLSSRYLVVDNSSKVDVKLLRRGGFAASLKTLN